MVVPVAMVSSTPPELATRPIGVAGERTIELASADGVTLDARLATPDGATRAVVIAHPHPLYGGSMEDPVTVALTRVLAERGAATLRFDFRGVGRSGGRHHGTLEIDDLLAATQLLAQTTSLPLAIVGYSFGSWVALQAARRSASIDRIALLAPALTILKYDGSPRYERPIAIALGDRDGFSDPTRARVLGRRPLLLAFASAGRGAPRSVPPRRARSHRRR